MGNSKKKGYRLLRKAIKNGNKERALNLLQSGIDVDDAKSCDSDLLHLAIVNFDDLVIITMLLDKGANINAKNKHNKKPLQIAIMNNKIEAIVLLTDRKNLGPQSSELSPKYIAKCLIIDSRLEWKTKVKTLLECGYSVNPKNYGDPNLLYGAVENGHTPIVEELLEHGIDVDMVNSKTGLNLLTIACLNEHHEIVKKLVENNANVNVRTSWKNIRLKTDPRFEYNLSTFRCWLQSNNRVDDSIDVTGLHVAVFNCDLTMAIILLTYSAMIEDFAEFFALIYIAVKSGCKKIVQMLLNYGIKMTDINSDGKTLLHFCVDNNLFGDDDYYYIAKMFLEKGAHIHLYTPNNPLLFEAIKNHHRHTAQLFLSYNPNVQFISSEHETSLHKAIKYKYDARFIKTLLKLNSPVNTIDSDGYTPLLDACMIDLEDKLEIIEALLQYNANVDCTNRYLTTPLHKACHDRDYDLVKMLLKMEASPNAKDHDGETPLHILCKREHLDNQKLIQLMMEHGANIEAVDERGWTPLFTACHEHNLAVVKFLLNHYANLNHTDLEQQTPLHDAVKITWTEVTKILIRYNADLNCLNKNNQTALQVAVELYRHYQPLSSIRRNNLKVIIKILSTQIIKLMTAGLKVNHDDWKIVYLSNFPIARELNFFKELQKIEKECEREINKMKEEHIIVDNETDVITFDNLLKKRDPFLRRFIDNEDIQSLLRLPVYNEKYPLYINIVRGRFRDVKYRSEVINSAKRYFHKFMYQGMPDECIDMVLDYLSVGDLIVFIEAMKSINGL